MKSLLSIDVEDWFQVENLKQAINKKTWEYKASRIERKIYTERWDGEKNK